VSVSPGRRRTFNEPSDGTARPLTASLHGARSPKGEHDVWGRQEARSHRRWRALDGGDITRQGSHAAVRKVVVNPFQPPGHAVDSALRPPALDTPAPDTARAHAIGDKIKRLRRQSLPVGALGLALQATRYIDSGGLRPASPGGTAFVLLPALGTCLLIYALSLRARMRNRSPWWGALGLGSCLGVVGLLLLPKKCHFCNASTKGQRCQHCGAPAPI
jgi:hypothetical protein